MESLVGRRLAHFHLGAVLGEGGMGVVYRATDEKLRRPVALKVLPTSIAENAERRARFDREARSAAAVVHANIAAIYEVGEAEGHPFISMELVEGETLRRRIERGLSVADSVRFGREIARGLERAHEKGIVHRDLKPENVMITANDEVKILDFGLAKLRGADSDDLSALANANTEQDLTHQGRVMGTPGYMSPEQAEGRAVDARTDVFAFGVLFFEMLTGEQPFEGLTAFALTLAVSRDAPKRASDLNADVSPELSSLVARCLEKRPEDRYPSAHELLGALTAASAAEYPSRPANPQAYMTTQSAPVVTHVSTADASVVPATPRARSRRWLLAAAPVAVVAALLAQRGLGRKVTAANEGAPSASASASVARAPTVTRIIDLPPPPTKFPTAATEYASGIQAIHDDDWFTAAAHFQRAIDVDPSMALAHLRLSITMAAADPAVRRTEYAKAAALRGQLGPRDQAFLEALQPYLQAATQDIPETDRRLRSFAARYPGDAEAWMLLGLLHPDAPEANLPAAEHALALDPEDAQSWETKGRALVEVGRIAEARDAFERCSALSVDGADCLAFMGYADALAGKCVDYEKDSRGAADRAAAYAVQVLGAMVSRGAPAEALDERLKQSVPQIPRFMGPELQRSFLEGQLALVAGDFARAKLLAKAEDTAREADPTLEASYGRHYQTVAQRIDIASETGDRAELQRAAEAFVARSGAWEWQTVDGADRSLLFARIAGPKGDAAPAGFEATRLTWIDRHVARGVSRGRIWSYAYAVPALTESEARAALDVQPRFGAPLPFVTTFGGGSPEAELGRVLLLAGRVDDAIPHLQRAVAMCDLFVAPVQHVRAQRDLGRALEQKGDHAGACEAYGKVLAQWGSAKPRSVTADDARTRAKAIGCKL